jgi:hypothetical protein
VIAPVENNTDVSTTVLMRCVSIQLLYTTYLRAVYLPSISPPTVRTSIVTAAAAPQRALHGAMRIA